MGIALIAVGTLFNMGIERHPELGHFAIFALLIFIIGFAISAGPIIWVIRSKKFIPLRGGIWINIQHSDKLDHQRHCGWITFPLTSSPDSGIGNTFLLFMEL